MEAIKNLVAGFAGALALNVLHETYRRFDHDAPRADLVGEEALSKSLKYVGVQPPKGDNLYMATLAGDLISNTLYYSLIGSGSKKNVMIRGGAYGLAAGLGAVMAPKPMGLKDAPVTKTDKTKALTVAWYLTGGLVTALVLRKWKK